MVTLVSRESHQIKFPGGAVERRPPLAPISSTTVTVETGVVVFTLPGTNPHDWTRDTLAFPVGNPGPAANFVSGIASAAPTSFWTPMNNLTAVNVPPETIFVQVTGSDGVPLSGFGQVTFPGNTVPPPVGFAIDSSEVEYSQQAGQPVLALAIAVFGNCAAMLRASYTAYIVNDKAVLGPGGAAT